MVSGLNIWETGAGTEETGGGGVGERSPSSLTSACAPGPGRVPPIRIETSSSHVAEGQTLDLKCVVPGQPHAQVTWHRRGSSLPSGHQVRGLEKAGGGTPHPTPCSGNPARIQSEGRWPQDHWVSGGQEPCVPLLAPQHLGGN